VAPLDVVIKYVTDTTQAIAGNEKISSSYQTLGKNLQKTGLAMSAAITLPIALAGKAAVDKLEEMQKVGAQTNAVIKSTGGVANVTAAQVDELAASMAHKSGIDEESIKSSENLLLTFKDVRNEAGKGNDIFTQATKATQDLSVAFGKDLSASAIIVGKALEDPVKGATALRRIGVQLTATQQDQIKAFVASGDVMSAQKIILGELTSEVGGSANAYGKTLAGQVAIAKDELLHAGAAIVGSAAPALGVLASVLGKVAGFLSGLPGPLQAAIGGFAIFAAAIGPILTITGSLMRVWGALGSALSSLGGVIMGDIVPAFGAMTLAGAAATAGITLAVAAVVGFVAWATLSQSASERAADAGKKWVDQQVASANATHDNAAALAELQAKYNVVTPALADAKNLLAEYQKVSTNNTAAQKEFGLSAGEVQARLVPLDAAVSELQTKHDGLATAIKNAKEAMAQQAIAAAAQQASNERLAQSAQGVASANDAQVQSIMKVSNAYLAAQGGPVALAAAQLQVEQAQNAVNDANAKYLPGSLEVRTAENQLEQAKLGVAAAAVNEQKTQADLANVLKTEGVPGLIVMRDSLVATEQAHHDATGATQEQINKINELIGFLASLKPPPPIIVTAETDEAHTKLSQLNDHLDAVTRGRNINIGILLSGGLPGGAGLEGEQGIMRVPGSRGQPYGPVMLHGGERVVPAHAIGGTSSGGWGSDIGGSAPTFNINVNVPVSASPADTGRAIIDSIRHYERIGGKSWRN
jgi:hypothetical protein